MSQEKPRFASIITDFLGNMQNRGCTANLYGYGFHTDLSYGDKDTLTSSPITDLDERGKLTPRRKLLTANALCQGRGREPVPVKPNYNDSSERTVIIATNAAETGVTFDSCMMVVDTCLQI